MSTTTTPAREADIDHPVRPGDIKRGILDAIEGVRDPVKDDSEELGIPPGWPKNLWVLSYSTGQHGFMCFNGTHGLAAFKKRANCIEFAKIVKNPPSRAWIAKCLSFDDARKLAKTKAEATKDSKDPITALILADIGPMILFVA